MNTEPDISARPRRMRAGALLTAILVGALAACGGRSDGGSGADGSNGLTALVAVTVEAPGSNCASGGSRIAAGLDTNANGALETAEVSSTQYICNGAAGASGPAGPSGVTGAVGGNGSNALVAMIAEPAGANCANAGKKVSVGIDANRNGVLDPAEVSSSSYVCNGGNGSNGANGSNGTNGSNGANGSNGLSSLIAIAPEGVGANCSYGGSKVASGLDSNGNAVLDASEITTTTYVCNGPPGAGLVWLDVTATSVQAQPNTGYVIDNPGQVTVTLPASPGIGDVVRVVGRGPGGWTIAQNPGQYVLTKVLDPGAGVPRDSTRSWTAIASSADGSKLVAAGDGLLYTSTDYGVSWTPHAGNHNWTALASSADGIKLVAVAAALDHIYTSTDSGATWTPRETAQPWVAVASSADGSKLVAAVIEGTIYTSTDSGVTWSPRESNRFWTGLASSADGSKLVAVASGTTILGSREHIYTSTDSGLSWTPRESLRVWTAVASSADGSRLLAGETQTNSLHVSADGGLTWTTQGPLDAWQTVASSANGSKLVAVGSAVRTSSDYGLTWTTRQSFGQQWTSVASSSDGARLAATTNGIYVFTFSTRTEIGTTGSISAGQEDALELIHLGGGVFDVVSYSGTTFVVK